MYPRAPMHIPACVCTHTRTHPHKHTPQFGIGELTHVALERCATARCAIDLMGSLAEEHGFYEPTGEGGEALTIIDPYEAWVFSIVCWGVRSALLAPCLSMS